MVNILTIYFKVMELNIAVFLSCHELSAYVILYYLTL